MKPFDAEPESLLLWLLALPIPERVRYGRMLADTRTAGLVAAVTDAAVHELTRVGSYDEVADVLGEHVGSVKRSIWRHNRRMRTGG